jgi:hypothetical protein
VLNLLGMFQNVVIILPRWRRRFCGGAVDSKFVGGVDHA